MQTAALAVTGLTVRYGPTTALDGVDVEVATGEIHALLGENGAGKSTMVKALSGLIRPDDGTIAVFGERVLLRSPRHAHNLGIRTAFQEMSLIKDLTVAQNFMLMEEPVNLLGIMRTRKL